MAVKIDQLWLETCQKKQCEQGFDIQKNNYFALNQNYNYFRNMKSFLALW